MSEKIEAGVYKGRGIEGSVQTGTTANGNDQIAVNLDIPALGRQLTTFLYFSDKAAPFALERLRALGWEGGDDPSFPGISRKEVDVQIKYEPNPKKNNELTMKVEIVTGTGTVTLSAPMADQEKRGFMARLAKLDKQAGGSAAPAPAGKLAL